MKSDLFTLLSRLTIQENKKFELFLKNEYLCQNKTCHSFFRELLHYYPLYNIEQKQKEFIYEKVFSDKNYNDSTFRSLIRALLISLEDFLLIENIKFNKCEREYKLSKIYSTLNLSEVSIKKLDELKSALLNNKEGDLSSRFLYLYDHEIINYNVYESNRKVLHKSDAENSFTLINKANTYLTLYYLVEIISNYINYRIQQLTYDEHTESLEVIFTASDLKRLDDMFKYTEYEFAYLLYKNLYLLYYEKPSKKNFLVYKSQLIENVVKLSQKELLHHNNSLISFCIINKNHIPELADELWKLYEFYLDKELYLADSAHQLDTYLFRSIIFLGLKLGYLSQVKEVIDKYSIKLNPEDIINMKELGYSYYCYYTGEYEKAKDHALKVKLNDYAIKYDIKNLLVKIYFEEGSFDQLSSAIKCYKEFLRNDKLLNDEIKQGFRHFIYYTEHLAKEIDSGNIQEVSYLLNKLDKQSNVYSKDWLIKMYRSVSRKGEYAHY